MGYRDDREALRQKNEELEQALARARGEIDELKGHPPDAIDVARPHDTAPGPVHANQSLTMLGLGGLGLSAMLLGAGVPAGAFAPPLALLLGLGLAIAKLVVLAGPNEAVVLSGLGRKRSDGTHAAYRVVHSGRALRRPFVETESRLGLCLFNVEVIASDMRLADGKIVEARLAACAKIDSQPEALERAVERFLGREPAEQAEAVRSAVLTAARAIFGRSKLGAASGLPETISSQIREEAEDELRRVGLTLWTVELLELEEAGPR